MSPEKMIPAISPAPAGETGGGFQNTVAALRFPGASHPPIAPLPRNSLAFSAAGGASAVSPSGLPWNACASLGGTGDSAAGGRRAALVPAPREQRGAATSATLSEKDKEHQHLWISRYSSRTQNITR